VAPWSPNPPEDFVLTTMSTTPGATFLYSCVRLVVVEAACWAGTEATTDVAVLAEWPVEPA